MTLHDLLDWHYGPDGDDRLRRMLRDGADPNARSGPASETPLHVATRRRRPAAVAILLDHGADLDARTAGGKTAYAHAARRGFDDVTDVLVDAGAPLNVFDATHQSSPLGWAVHGSRYSGGADARQDAYVALTRLLLEAGAALHDPHGEAYNRRLLEDASPRVGEVLRAWPRNGA